MSCAVAPARSTRSARDEKTYRAPQRTYHLSGLTQDLVLVPSRPMPDACYPLVCLLCVCGGVSSRGAVLAVPPIVPVLVLQDSILYRMQVV